MKGAVAGHAGVERNAGRAVISIRDRQGAGAVGSAEIAAGVVGSAEIAADAVTTAKIADDAVTLAKITAGTDGELITWDVPAIPPPLRPARLGESLSQKGLVPHQPCKQ